MKRVLRLLAPVVALTIVAALTFVGATAAEASNGVPYTDPNAVGYIGLCDKAGHQITHGNIHTSPLAWRAVSSSPAQAPYNGSGRTATLLAYQPRQGLAPGEWSGEEITASSRYTNPDHPMVAATSGDDSLAYFTSNFHPAWDGLVQLRIYLGAPNEPAYSYKYPVLDLKVTGNTWHTVDGGPAACSSGTSESIETILLPSPTPKPRAGSATPSAGRGSSAPTGAPSGGGQSPRPGGVVTGASDAASASSSGHAAAITIAIVAAIVLLAISGFFVVRRRRMASADGPPPSSEGRSRKGH